MVAAYENGATARAVGRLFGISRHTVTGHLKARGIALRHRPLGPEQVAEAIRLYGQGWSLARVGEHFGRDATLIHLVLKREGVPRRDCQGREVAAVPGRSTTNRPNRAGPVRRIVEPDKEDG